MEKNKPHCPLLRVKSMILSGQVRATVTAVTDAYHLGFDDEAMYQEVLLLESSEFYKSMTTYNNHTVWQDVYRHRFRTKMIYIKLTVVDDVLIVSFKEL